MFLFIPLLVFVLSILAIFLVISRKFVYLKKLSPDVIDESSLVPSAFMHSLWGELFSWFKNIDIRGFSIEVLSFLEKTVRKLRLLVLKVDSFSHQLIARIRVSAEQRKKRKIVESQTTPVRNEIQAPQPTSTIRIIEDRSFRMGYDIERSKQYLMEEEQRLIMAIAKSPKDAQLYKELGDVYMDMQEWDDALQSLEFALALDPEDTIIKKKLLKIKLHLEKMPE